MSNKCENFFYSYWYFLWDVVMCEKKTIHKIVGENYVMPYCVSGDKLVFHYLPLVDFNVSEHPEKYVSILKDAFKKASKISGGKIIIGYAPETCAVLAKIPNVSKPRKRDTDYFYDTTQISKLSGIGLKCIRRQVNLFERLNADCVFRKMNRKDVPQLLELIIEWKRQNREKMFRIADMMMNRNYFNFPATKQYNYVVELHGKIVAVSGSYIPYETANYADIFITKALRSDSFSGLSEYLFVKSHEALAGEGITLTNYAGSLGMKGLKNFKEKLKPVKEVTDYSIEVL